MKATSVQQLAVTARGNVLVVAGAGTGKTRTLVERCLHCLTKEQPPATLDEILVVTFTEAAAAEIRQRISARLQEELALAPDGSRWREQLALFETAHIGTLHSFCLQVIRQQFYELELDPQLTVLEEEEARLLAEETLEAVLNNHYQASGQSLSPFQELVQSQGRGGDEAVRGFILKVHNYTQTLPDPSDWFREQSELFGSPEPVRWQQWLLEAALDWRQESVGFLESLAVANPVAVQCAAALKPAPAGLSRRDFSERLKHLLFIRDEVPRGKRTEFLSPLSHFFTEAEFLNSVTSLAAGEEPLKEDWNWVRPQMLALLELAREFGRAFADAKRELGALDFHDLEQHALRLLWDTDTGQPTAVARQWRERLRFIFVDEYQDINAAQDKIIEALSREGPHANRFLVGDMKQSIYRFRLANPRIFQAYTERWRGAQGKTIPLTENFRSREGVLEFVNSLFGLLMRRELGGLSYDDDNRLRFGNADDRRKLSLTADSDPRVELHLRFKGGNAVSVEETSEPDSRVVELEDADREARLVALRLRELKEQRHKIWDEAVKQFRAVEWSDMAVLLRSPATKAGRYARAFSCLGVPLVVSRSGFYDCLEISDLLNLLLSLDNPLQDLPLISVLRSPLVGLTLEELGTIRLAGGKVHYWTALQGWHTRSQRNEDRPLESAESGTRNSGPGAAAEVSAPPGVGTSDQRRDAAASALEKVGVFLERFARWRRLARQESLSCCLEAVLAETYYDDWLRLQLGGEQRHANVRRLLGLAQQFDRFQRQGLFRFLRFVQAQQAAETEPETAAAGEQDTVRLLSIHQSKGLEFPVVAVADLGKPFNLSDVRAEIILDERFGLCPQIKPPSSGMHYPSLPYWLARRRQTRETLGEELRLLYVATTRARDTLILVGSITENKFNLAWQGDGTANPLAASSARSYADWVGLWFSANCGSVNPGQLAGDSPFCRWVIHRQESLPLAEEGPAAGPPQEPESESSGLWEELRNRLAWRYPYTEVTCRPAKTSVSALRREAVAFLDEEADALFAPPIRILASDSSSGQLARAGVGAPADIGIVHHRFLQFVPLDMVGGPDELEEAAKRMERDGILAAGESALLDFAALAGFWQTELGRKVQAHATQVRRELAFTARFSLRELTEMVHDPPLEQAAEEFVIVQGVVDLAVIRPAEIWLVDFKTDEASEVELPDKVQAYAPQLRLYARALSRIYRRPVTERQLYFLSRQTGVAVVDGVESV